jgi:phage-related protein
MEFRETPEEVKIMEEFLNGHKGVTPFIVSDPDEGVPIRVICEGFSKEPRSGARHVLRAKFDEYLP